MFSFRFTEVLPFSVLLVYSLLAPPTPQPKKKKKRNIMHYIDQYEIRT